MSPHPATKQQPDVPESVEMQSAPSVYDATAPPPQYNANQTYPHPESTTQSSQKAASQKSMVTAPHSDLPLAVQTPLGSSNEKWRDLPFAIFFWIHFFALMAVGWWAFSRHNLSFSGSGNAVDGNVKNSPWIIVAIDLLVAIITSFIFLLLTKAHPYFMIQASLILGLALNVIGLALAIWAGSPVAVIFAIIILLLNVWFVYWVQYKIPFSAALLRIAIHCTEIFPSTYLVVLGGFLLNVAWVFLFWFTAGSIIYEMQNYSNINQSAQNFIYFLLAISFFWTAEIIKNLVWVTVSGICGTWYFLYPNNVPAHPVLSSLYRACTYSFGSIAFGSLIVAIVKAFRLLLRYIQNSMNQQNNIIFVIIIACAQCLLAITESIINYINSYAYVHVALYGETYIQAAKSTFNLFAVRGFDAIINDSLIEGVTFMLELIVAVLTAIVSALVASAFALDWEVWIGIGFIIGLFVTRIVTAVIEAVVITIFVGLAEDPLVFATTKLEEYNTIYPQLKQRGVDLAANADAVPMQAIPV